MSNVCSAHLQEVVVNIEHIQQKRGLQVGRLSTFFKRGFLTLLSDTFVGTRLPSNNWFNTISHWIHAKLQALSPCADNVIILAEVTSTWSLHTCAISCGSFDDLSYLWSVFFVETTTTINLLVVNRYLLFSAPCDMDSDAAIADCVDACRQARRPSQCWLGVKKNVCFKLNLFKTLPYF